MRDYSTAEKLATPFLGTCKRCASGELYTKNQGPHVALLCRDCGLWQRWVPKREAHRYCASRNRQPRVIRIPSDDNHQTCHERFEKIERELTVVVRAILACGVLQGAQSPPLVNVDDNLVDRFVREVEE